MQTIIGRYAEMVNGRLLELVPNEGDAAARAMAYSLHSGGKRIRPAIAMEFCRACGGAPEHALELACALEMVHTYSLIHDDLPCMDDDDMRRGKEACHIVFGEAVALLAGDGLLNRAAETAIAFSLSGTVPAGSAILAAYELFIASGSGGMIAGQVMDLELSNGGEASLESVTKMNMLKTGRLITAAARIGVRLGGGNEDALNAATSYAGKVGLAFQIRDDLLDREGNEQKLGKRTGADARQGKTGFVELLGAQGALGVCERLTREAKADLAALPGQGVLPELADYLCARDR